MPGNEFLGRTRSLGSRRQRHPGQLGLISSNSIQKSPGHAGLGFGGKRKETSPARVAVATADHQLFPPYTDRTSCTREPSSQGKSNRNQSDGYSSLDAEMIGLAFGSPRESPMLVVTEAEDSRSTCKSPESMSTVQSGSNTSTSLPEKERSKRMKWKNLGNLFGKKAVDASSLSAPFYQVELPVREDTPHQLQTRYGSHEVQPPYDLRPRFNFPPSEQQAPNVPFPAGSPVLVAINPRRKPSFRKKLSEKHAATSFRPAILRSRTMPIGDERSPMRPPRDGITPAEPALLRTNGGPLLEVDIPSEKLERYSIMFSSLLHPQPQSSLSTHGQGLAEGAGPTNNTDQKVGTLVETNCLPPPGRAHPPSPAQSPSFSLFPPASPIRGYSQSRKQPLERSPLHRSATAIGLTTPRHPSFEQDVEAPRSQGQDPVVLVVHSPSGVSSALEKEESRNVAYELSRHSQASTEASFRTAPESHHTDLTPNGAISQRKFPTRTSSGEGGEPLRNKSVERSELETEAYPRFQRPNLAPHTPRLSQRKLEDKRSKRSETTRDHLPAEAVSHRDAMEAPRDKTESGSGSALASSAPRDPIRTQRSIHSAAAAPAKSTKPPTIATSAPMAHIQEAAPRLPKKLFSQQINSPPPSRLSTLPCSDSSSPEDLNNAAEISIARQISVSQRQRELLIPIVPKVARQPMFVDIRSSAIARKSQHLVLEDA